MAKPKGSSVFCEWIADFTEYDTGQYETSCENAFVILEGTPKDNKMKFCCYCGKPLKEKLEGRSYE